MDIFKLFFDHDLRMDKLSKRNANKTQQEVEATLQDFMKPAPTYSKFYLSGTRLKEEKFGLNVLETWPAIRNQLEQVFDKKIFFLDGQTFTSLSQTLSNAGTGDAMAIGSSGSIDVDLTSLNVDSESNIGHFKEELSEVLLDGYLVLYKEQAPDGFDLHLFSKQNIYQQLFHAFKPLVSPSFRFFSINSKRMGSERHFYFETWTLGRPPHGAEEVLPETVL